MPRSMVALMTLALLPVFLSDARAESITIPNYSFEEGSGEDWPTTGSGWINPGGYYRAGRSGSWPNDLPPTVGSYAGYITGDWTGSGSGGSFEQTLSATLLADATYTLTVDVGCRSLWSGYGGFAPYQIQLLAGGEILAMDNTSLTPDPGKWLTSTITYNSGSSSLGIGENLTIRFTADWANHQYNYEYQAWFDDVRLDVTSNTSAVPLPPAALAGFGLLALLGAGRKFRRRIS